MNISIARHFYVNVKILGLAEAEELRVNCADI